MCTHNINKTFCYCKIKKTNRVVLILSRNTSQKLNRNSANTCLTDMINIFIECYKLLQQNNSNQKLKTLSLAYVIRKDAFLSKGVSNEEIWGVRIVNFMLFYFILFYFILFYFILFLGPLCQDCVCMQYKYPTVAF